MTSGRPSRLLALALSCGALAFAATSSAQQPAGPTDNGAGGNNGNGAGGSTSPAPSAPVVPSVYGVVAPPPPGEPIGGGNATESSSRPVTGDKEDGFDYSPAGGGGPTTVYGGSNAPVFFQDHPRSTVVGMGGPAPSTHLVQKGETLWGICGQAFNNPYQWPRIWSYNPQIQNPHWIYPNEQLRLKAGVPLTAAPGVTTPRDSGGDNGGGAVVANLERVAPGTVFLRDEGFVNDDSTLNWGSVVGSPSDKMYLSDFDEAYVRVASGHDVKIGQELTVFRPIRSVADGQVIALQGTLRIDDWNPQTRIARAQVVETIDAIERGARVGPVTRSFEVVAPKRNQNDVTAHVLISAQTHAFYGQNQVVFIDQGSDAGLEVGNRLFVVRHGDAWRQSMVTDQTARRIMGEREEPAVLENTPRIVNEEALPEEVTAELRVVNVQKKSATCLVTQSRREIEIGEPAIARKGY
jgi:hypothetical protein